ncbi:hypothetical protein BC833DRAFT_576682 [Globomyces pollinis-pini]|nr:hypothetical protein BC833DRAFT_576682 [Globomyces pollinis-pini]
MIIGSAPSLLVGSGISFAQNQIPPPMPAQWPGASFSQEQLNDPLVANALEYVQSVVPAALLAIPQSTAASPSYEVPRYNADAGANCYWPTTACSTPNSLPADIISCPGANDWGLTYDDGPSRDGSGNDTPGLLTALGKANAKATFFMVGARANQFPDVVESVKNNGHQVGSHSWTHTRMTLLTNAQIVAEIKYTEAIIYKAAGVVPRFFRPPYGDIDNRVRAILNALGYTVVLWTTDPNPQRNSFDTSGDVPRTVRTVQSWFVAQPGFISLQHDVNANTCSAAIQILESIPSVPNFPLNIKPVGSCAGGAWYQ